MSYVDPSVQKQFGSLSPALQKAILDKHGTIRSLQDLIRALEEFAGQT